VVKAEDDVLRTARLALTAATAQALRNGLGLLGIRVPERM
jgi:arginyl-tRNA synthetase